MEIRTNIPLNTLWLKATVTGSLWASVEVILGSFLHNLNFPLSGTILSFISVYLLIAFLQIWKEPGMIWRAGVICALMKSISPSAIILGPMVGIISEALLLELFIFIFGRNLLGYMTGGAIAVFSAMVHKLVSLLITYGMNLVRLVDELYHYCMKQIHLDSVRPLYLVLLICIVYLAAGMTAALLGYISGMKYRKQQHSPVQKMEFLLSDESGMFHAPRMNTFSLYYLALNVLAITISLILINNDMIIAAILVSIAYITFSIYRYRTALRRFKKISVWIQFFFIILFASLLWTGISEHELYSASGLIIGLKMNFRAVLIIIGFTAISVELKNPLIKSILYRKGFSSLYQSLGLAFSALPGIISSLPKPEKNKWRWKFPLQELFGKAEGLLQAFEEEHNTRPDVVIITGAIREGKTTFTKDVVEILLDRGIRVSGFLAKGMDADGERTGFRLLNIATGEEFELCTTKPNQEFIRQGIYYFDPANIRKGLEILNSTETGFADLLVIDEIGPMELNDHGWAAPVGKLCRKHLPVHLWVVRRDLADLVSRKWNVGTICMADISKDTAEEVAEAAEKMIRKQVSYHR
jgi:nucleoside-triphosphatase THEP1